MRPSASALSLPVRTSGVQAAALPGAIVQPAEPVGDFTARTRIYEARLLREAMEASRFNQRAAARALGLTYYQLRHHLKGHGMLGRQTGPAEDVVSTGDAT